MSNTTFQHDSGTSVGSFVLPVHKPVGPTSRRIIDEVQTHFPEAKIGHGGTLDPLAEGVLPLHVNEATKVVSCLHKLPKTYRVRCRFDLRSETLDLGDSVDTHEPAHQPNRSELHTALKSFEGTIKQVPPTYSAIKRNGVPLHELARSDRDLPSDIEARSVTCYAVNLIDYSFPAASITIDCGKGFYIRALVRDLANELGLNGGIVTSLVRSKYGSYALSNAINLESVAREWQRYKQPVRSATSAVPNRNCSQQELDRIVNGATIPRQDSSTSAAAIGPDNKVHALLEPDGANHWKPKRVLNRGF